MPRSDDRIEVTPGAALETPAFSRSARLWLARAAIGLVLLWNVQCALAFLIDPATFALGFELSGEAGGAAIRGIGLLFLMWNVPYAVALWHPIGHRVSLYEALAMQAIGLLGESFIFLSLSATHVAARGSLTRFIVFDAAGLVLLVLAFVLVRLDPGSRVNTTQR